MTIGEAYHWAKQKLSAEGIADAPVDARLLLTKLSGLSTASLYFDAERALDDRLCERYRSAVERRASHVPLQYITGEQEFMGLPFLVSPAVLIPRQDTECLVEGAMRHCSGRRVLDMCTGSGCIILSLAKLCGLSAAVGVDVSAEALAVAARNARALGVEVCLIQSDLFGQVAGTFDVIVSNPPYIRTGELAGLMPEVRDHEPRMALDGDADGLCFYRRIAGEAGGHLSDGGMLFLEIGCDQAEAVTGLLSENGFGEISVGRDYAGLDRVVSGRFYRK